MPKANRTKRLPSISTRKLVVLNLHLRLVIVSKVDMRPSDFAVRDNRCYVTYLSLDSSFHMLRIKLMCLLKFIGGILFKSGCARGAPAGSAVTGHD
jgi:hypothetical protein